MRTNDIEHPLSWKLPSALASSMVLFGFFATGCGMFSSLDDYGNSAEVPCCDGGDEADAPDSADVVSSDRTNGSHNDRDEQPAPAKLTVAPTTYDFGVVPVNQDSPVATFPLSNTGNGEANSLSYSIEGNGASTFSLSTDCGPTLAAQTSCDLNVTFHPKSDKDYDASLLVHSGTKIAATVALQGKGGYPTIAITPPSWSTEVVWGTGIHPTVVLIVENRGNTETDTLKVDLHDTESAFSISQDTCSGFHLQPHATCELKVSFVASNVASYDAQVLVTDNDSQGTAQLSGRVLAPSDIAFVPSPVAFGDVWTKSTMTKKVKLTNTGEVDIDELNLSVPSGAPFSLTFDKCTGKPLPAHTSCTTALKFAPTNSVSYSGKLLASWGTNNQTDTLLTGRGLEATLGLAPSFVDFGIVHKNNIKTRTVVVSNSGNAADYVHISVGGSSVYSISPTEPCQNKLLAPSTSCSFLVRVLCKSSGTKSGTLLVSGNHNNAAKVPLHTRCDIF